MNLKSSATLSIGRLAERFGLATHVLRHWEEVGLIEPRRVNGRRYYGEDHVARVTMILRAKEAGLSLAQIRTMLLADKRERRAILARHRAALDEHIRTIEAAKALIDHALDCRAVDFTTCVEFQAVARSGPEPAHDRGSARI